MSPDGPIAFLSYVRADDEHDHGRITSFRERLEGEVRMQTGRQFKIFQDKNDIKWGQNWKERLDGTLLSVTFLIPVITPSYFFSDACRDEFEKFLLRERQLGENRLILPIYYLESDAVRDSGSGGGDSIARIVSSRNWADWRNLRFKPLTAPEVEGAIAEMAKTIKHAMKELESVIAAAKETTHLPSLVTPQDVAWPASIANFSPVVPTMRYGNSKQFSRSSGIDKAPYYAYTKLYDEEIHAEDLSSKEELVRLNAFLSKTKNDLKKNNQKLISNFQSKVNSAANKDDFSITILVDNSGSMRGDKIRYSAAWVQIFSEILDKCNVPAEILGFTTKSWKGGLSRERWVQDGKQERPGRLNDLRHIIYKEFGVAFARCRNNFGLMVREGILKENIDGESLLWAYERASNKNKKQKIIIVISDGEPIDDSTLAANHASMLGDHLASTVRWIEAQQDFCLFAISIDDRSNPGRFYSNSIMSNNLPDIGQSLVSIVSNILK
jgi:hypothetical protein